MYGWAKHRPPWPPSGSILSPTHNTKWPFWVHWNALIIKWSGNSRYWQRSGEAWPVEGGLAMVVCKLFQNFGALWFSDKTKQSTELEPNHDWCGPSKFCSEIACFPKSEIEQKFWNRAKKKCPCGLTLIIRPYSIFWMKVSGGEWPELIPQHLSSCLCTL
jgi:hypothetical protein